MRFRGQYFSQWQEALRAQIYSLIGLRQHEGIRIPLNARTLWKRDHSLGTIEKIVFTSEEDAEVAGYVCIPKSSAAPHTWFICLQGHSSGMHNSIAVDREDEALPIVVEGDRDFAIGCMNRGLAALCIEQRSLGERRELRRSDGTGGCHEAAMNALMLGRTLLGERVFDVDRAVDYLEQRGDCRMERLGVMGNSGGGTVALFAAALLPRIRLAMPSSSFCSFQKSIMAMKHCACNYVPGLLLAAEMGDIAGLIAPRPLILVNGEADEIFPIDGAREEFSRVKEMYAAAGAPDDCHHVVCSGGHRFYADAAWKVFFEHYRPDEKEL